MHPDVYAFLELLVSPEGMRRWEDSWRVLKMGGCGARSSGM